MVHLRLLTRWNPLTPAPSEVVSVREILPVIAEAVNSVFSMAATGLDRMFATVCAADAISTTRQIREGCPCLHENSAAQFVRTELVASA